MKHNNVIAIDLAKNIFQVCVMTKHNKIISNKPISRAKLIAWLPNNQSHCLRWRAVMATIGRD